MGKRNTEHMTHMLCSALRASRKAGEAIVEVYRSGFSIEQKKDHSPLTVADKRSHAIITDLLSSSECNRIPVLSEEGKAIPFEERNRWEYFWLVDPLDGTKEFIQRTGEFTVNIALIYKDMPVLGSICIPLLDAFYFGAEGLGAYKMVMDESVQKTGLTLCDTVETFDDIVNVSQRLPLKHPPEDLTRITIVGSRSHRSHETEEYIHGVREKGADIDFLSAGSSLKFCMIAEGSADVYPRCGPTMEWDTAAGQIIVEESGGSVLMYGKNEPLKYNKQELVNPYFVAFRKGIVI